MIWLRDGELRAILMYQLGMTEMKHMELTFSFEVPTTAFPARSTKFRQSLANGSLFTKLIGHVD